MTKPAALLLTIVLSCPVLSGAQVLRCTDGVGKVHFSDKPCEQGQQGREVKIYKDPPPMTPVATQGLSPEAQAYEKERQRRREQSRESQRRIDESSQEVRKIRSDNQSPRKCAEARFRIEQMQKRAPLMYKSNPDYFEFQQSASLYCGN